MKWFSLKLAALGMVAVLLGLVSVQSAAANYPPPAGSATLSASATTAATGTDVALTLTVVDSAGSALAGKACTLYVASQPGSDASVSQSGSTTDANGVLTGSLYTGTTPGAVQVVANCGNLFAGVTVLVSGAVVPPQAPVEPVGITLPPTGFAPAAGTLWTGIVAAMLCGGILAVGAGCALRLAGTRVRDNS
ncbi:MAG: Ig-like domain-containing protein [Dehalococcoidia bacterium]|nr:Ig-like domain-containing protein [Dehalococcoidia bacterium]